MGVGGWGWGGVEVRNSGVGPGLRPLDVRKADTLKLRHTAHVRVGQGWGWAKEKERGSRMKTDP